MTPARSAPRNSTSTLVPPQPAQGDAEGVGGAGHQGAARRFPTRASISTSRAAAAAAATSTFTSPATIRMLARAHRAARWSTRCATLPTLRDAAHQRRHAAPGNPHPARDLDLAAQLGVTVASISETIRIATLGDLDQNSAKFSLVGPTGADPREPARGQPPRPGDAREPAGADRGRRRGAAEGGGRYQLRRRARRSVRRYNQSRRIVHRGRPRPRASSSARP